MMLANRNPRRWARAHNGHGKISRFRRVTEESPSPAASFSEIYDLEKYGMKEAGCIIPVSHYTGEIIATHYETL